MERVNYLLDTNILLKFGLMDFIETKSNAGIIIPLIVIQELDRQKYLDGVLGYQARKAIREIGEIKKYGDIKEWVSLQNNISVHVEKDFDKSNDNIEYSCNDDLILATSCLCNKKYGRTILVSNDLALILKAETIGISTESANRKEDLYKTLYSGKVEIEVEDFVIDKFYKDKKLNLSDLKLIPYENQFVIMTSNINNKKTAVGIYKNGILEKLQYEDFRPSKITPRNLEQKLAIELLMRDDIPMVSLSGLGGSAKTFISLAVALEKVLDKKSEYNKIVLVKPPISMDKNLQIGFKKGSVFDKYIHTLGSITSNLEALKEDKKDRFMNGIKLLEGYIEMSLVEICSIEDILGTSFNNCIVLADEMQLLTKENLYSLLSRQGSTRLFMTGDILQGSRMITTDTREMGYYHMIDAFKDSKLAGHLKLETIQRSKFVEELYKVW